MCIRCLMLDVDGVIVDGRPDDGHHWKTNLLEDLGISAQELSECFFKRDWEDIIVGKKDLLPAVEAALARMGSSVSSQKLIDYWFEKDSRIIEHVLSDCEAIREQGISIFLATNQEHQRANFLLETLGLGTHVDGMIYSAKVGHRKPHSKFYSFAQVKIGFEPHRILLVDDTKANIQAAIEAGWKATLWDKSEKLIDIVGRYTNT